MAKKKNYGASAPANRQESSSDKPATLKDLLNADLVKKLKDQADEMRAEEQRAREEKRKQEEAARKEEQKRLENNFEHLLNTTKMDWKKFK